MHAIVLVGGKGTRLMPLTKDRPKPLIRLGDYSILEVILRQLRAAGCTRVTLCISHLGEMIRSAFGTGQWLGLSIDYCADRRPLGTAAPLLLVEDWNAPAIVMNGDILTTIDFGDLYQQHLASGSLLTVAFQQRSLPTAVGVLQVADDEVEAMWEKPNFLVNISTGMYVADPLVRKYLPTDGPADMPDVVNALLDRDESVNGYGFSGEWHDIGTPARYHLARADFEADPQRYLRRCTQPEPALGTGDDGPEPGPDISILAQSDTAGAVIETRP